MKPWYSDSANNNENNKKEEIWVNKKYLDVFSFSKGPKLGNHNIREPVMSLASTINQHMVS